MNSRLILVFLFYILCGSFSFAEEEQVTADLSAVEKSILKSYEEFSDTLKHEKEMYTTNWDNIENALFSVETSLRQLHDSLSSLAFYKKSENVSYLIIGGGAVVAATFSVAVVGKSFFSLQRQLISWTMFKEAFFRLPPYGKILFGMGAVIVPATIIGEVFYLRPARQKLEKAVKRELIAAKKMYSLSCKTLKELLALRANAPGTLDNFRTLKVTCDGLDLAKAGENLK